MSPTRLEAFSDGVLAILITIMVLEFKVPKEATLAGLCEMAPTFLSYLLSFTVVAIYWMNHHHLIHRVRHVSGPLMWANAHLLFCLSFVPFATAYLGAHHDQPFGVAVYGAVSLACGLAWLPLLLMIVRPKDRALHLSAPNRRMVNKNILGCVIVGISIPLAFFFKNLAMALLVLPPVMYFLPEKWLETPVSPGD